MNNFIKVKNSEFITKITLSKPPLNILDIDDLIYLSETLKKLNNKKDLKLVTFESDQKVFSAGVNVSDHGKNKINELLAAFHEVFYNLAELNVPTVALVESGCYGGGCELALFCDMVIASEKAVFSLPEIKLGCYPPVAMAVLPSIVGNKKALELILTGKSIDAKEAKQNGLVNFVIQESCFDKEADDFINSILFNSSSVIKTTLKAFKNINKPDVKEKLALSEKIYLQELINLEDSEEGIKSFLEKRKPVWKNK